MTKNLLYIALGMFLMYLLLKILSTKKIDEGDSTAAFVDLAKTGQALNLVKTNEFKELVKTREFRDFVRTLADSQINAMSITLMK